MVKKLSITISDKTYRDYLQNFVGNKSNFIEEKFLYGLESDIYESSNLKTIINDTKTENRNLLEENRKLKLLNASLQSRLDKTNGKGRDVMSDKVELNTKKARALIRSGFLDTE